MGLRPAHCYRTPKRSWARTANRVPRKNFIGATPGLRTRQFNMGNGSKEYSHIVELTTDENILVRDNALESARMLIIRKLNVNLDKDSYFMRLRVYPHEILRENKLAQGAGADRVSKGMSHPFGRAIGRAVKVRPGQKIFSILIDEKDVPKAKKALKAASSRFPCDCTIQISTDVKSIGAIPKKTRDMIKAERSEKEETEGEEAKEEKGKDDKTKAAKDKKEEPKKAGAKK